MLGRSLADAGSDSTIARRVKKLCDLGILTRVREGVFLNKLCNPPAALVEAAGFIRSGAIVSLQSVLGDSGVLNNYTPDATVIIPSGMGNTTGGIIKTSMGDIIVRKLSPDLLYAGDLSDRLEIGVSYMRATPEKALVDWMALVKTGKSGLKTLPAHDIDLSMLNEDRLKRLSAATGVDDVLARLVESIEEVEDYNPAAPGF